MDERILNFIQNLKKQLEGLPQEEILEAVSFYEEYLNEAADAGKDLDSVIKELESPEEIASRIRMETSITRAQYSPGLGNFSNVFRNAFKYVSTPFSVFLMSVTAIISYGLVALFFAGAFALAAGAVAIFTVLVYEALNLSRQFVMEIVGTVGMGLFGAGICIIFAILLYKCGKLFIVLSAGIIRLILKISGKPAQEKVKKNTGRVSKLKKTMTVLLAASVAGLVLSGVSGLPWRYFIITNSMKPQEGTVKNVVYEYDTGLINRISVVTAYSVIKIEQGSSDRVTVKYEEPDWLRHEIGNTDGVLSFYEKSNGRLPLFPLISLHESRTGLLITLPKGFNPDSAALESTGGHIFISGLAMNIEAKTLNGSINYNSAGTAGSCDLKANT